MKAQRVEAKLHEFFHFSRPRSCMTNFILLTPSPLGNDPLIATGQEGPRMDVVAKGKLISQQKNQTGYSAHRLSLYRPRYVLHHPIYRKSIISVSKKLHCKCVIPFSVRCPYKNGEIMSVNKSITTCTHSDSIFNHHLHCNRISLQHIQPDPYCNNKYILYRFHAIECLNH